MYDQRLLILFYLQKARINKRNQCPIICRITYNKKRKQFSTGIYIEPENWNSVKQSTNNNQINTQLEFFTSEIRAAYLKLKVMGNSFSSEDIYKEFKGEKIERNTGLIEYWEKVLSKKKKLIGKELQQTTWDKFYYILNDLKHFVKLRYGKNEYLLTNLNLNFIDEFEFYLKTEKDHKQITVNKVLQRLKGVVKSAVGEQLIEKNPFYGHRPKRVNNKVIYLTQDELDLVENKPIKQVRLDMIRDCFVFCCYTGLAYKEMSNLRSEHIKKGFDGLKWIQMTREKTDKIISIPLLPKPIQLLNKYQDLKCENLLPIVSNQRFNSYLKEIADIVGINKNLTHHMARKTFASTVLLYNDVPMEIVSELLGHSSLKITQAHYGKVVQSKVSEQMINLTKRFESLE